MAKQFKNRNTNKKIPVRKVKSPTAAILQKPFWGLEEFLAKNQTKVILVVLFLSLLFSFLLFDLRISEGGDDSNYIMRSWDYIKKDIYPFYQGPLYPLFLSVAIRLFGINLFILKLLSVICALGNVWFTYLAFRKRIPYMVLFALVLFLAINNFYQYYASQTYTESFFLFLQAVALYFVMRVIDTMSSSKEGLKENKIDYKGFLLIGLCFMLLSLAKSIGIFCVVPVIFFFLLYRNYRYALYTFLSFLLFKIIYEGGIRMFYSSKFDAGQLNDLLTKVPYHPEQGYEDFGGLMTRSLTNFKHFMSVSVYNIFFHLENSLVVIKPVGFLAFITAVVLIIFTIMAYKRNRYIFFAGVYLVILSEGVFAGINAAQVQDRLLLIIVPYILLVVIYGLYQLTIKASVFRFCFFCLIIIFLGINLFNTIENSSKNFSVLKENMKGNMYYGYTEDWTNFLRMSAYCGDSLPPNSLVASRKASMSFIYGKGKEFYPVIMVTSTNPDTVLAKLKRDSVTHVLLASIRMNPKVVDGNIVNTLQRLLYPVAQKYPQKLTLVKQIGESEPAYLYKINY